MREIHPLCLYFNISVVEVDFLYVHIQIQQHYGFNLSLIKKEQLHLVLQSPVKTATAGLTFPYIRMNKVPTLN